MKFISLLFLCVAFTHLHSQSLKLGDKAPPLLLTQSWKENREIFLKENQLLLLDFWGTWCAPCIGVFPKLQKLKNKYEGQGLMVATLTDEKPEKVAAFFKKSKYAGFTFGRLVDSTLPGATEGMTFKKWSISTVPFSLIIDAEKTVRWIGTTHQLEDSIVANLLSNRSTNMSTMKNTGSSITPALLVFDTVHIEGFTIVTRQVYKESNNSMYNDFPETGPVHNSFKGMPLDKLLQHFYRVSPTQIQVHLNPGQTIPLVAYQIKRDSGARWAELAHVTTQVLAEKFGYRWSIEKKAAEVWTLQVKDEARLRKEAAPFDSTTGKSNQGFFGEELITRNFSLYSMKQLLEKHFPQQIFELVSVSESLQKSLFDFELPAQDIEALTSQLEKYGITVSKHWKELPFVVVKWK